MAGGQKGSYAIVLPSQLLYVDNVGTNKYEDTKINNPMWDQWWNIIQRDG